MSAPREDGLDAANDQPAKILTKHTAYFIARCGILAGQNPWVIFLAVIVVLEVGSLVLGVLQ
jgi:hypothetical protein